MRTRSFGAAFALVLALSLGACERRAQTHGTGQGTVAGVDLAKGEITLDHGEIPGMMGAMTMTFVVSDPKLIQAVAPGSKVEFDVEQRDGAYVVTAIRKR